MSFSVRGRLGAAFACGVLLLVSGCMNSPSSFSRALTDAPVVSGVELTGLKNLAPPVMRPTVAVYSFPDETGRRRDAAGVSSFSNAVTQGGVSLLIDALRRAGNGSWFRVVERNGLDHLSRERQIVRQSRDTYDGDETNSLPPLTFSDIILEGGIIGYDTNVISGGIGARYLGIGESLEYRKDRVTVALRAVSTKTGEVVLSVQVSKTIFSYGNNLSFFRFVDVGTKLIEAEGGMSENEAGTVAVKATIEAAVIELIEQGAERNFWQFQTLESG